MRVSKIRLGILAAASGLVLGGCAYGYDGYGGFGGVSVGYNSGYGYGSYGYDPYGYAGYGYDPYGYGYGYGSPYGWYDGFYYPGSGIYVYDSYRRRHAWNDTQRHYWQDRTSHWRDRRGNTNATTTVVTPRENWSGFDRSRTRSSDTTRSSDNGRWSGRWDGRSSSQSSSSSDTTTRSDRGWHSRHGSKND
jgi:hypothetical protein